MSLVSKLAEKGVRPDPLGGDLARDCQLTTHIGSSDERMPSMHQLRELPGKAQAKQVDRPTTSIDLILAQRMTEFMEVRDDAQPAGHHDSVGAGLVIAAAA